MNKRPDVTLLKSLPQIEEILKQPCMQQIAADLPHEVVTDAARAEVDALRKAILAGESPTINLQDIAQAASQRALRLRAASLRGVINASGVIIHTNLGRSVLAPEAVEAVNEVIRGYSTLEYSVENMARGSRHDHCEQLICALTGAEAAIAVNNNAAAVMMILSEFAAGHEAIVSRGELVEIGGSFRIPDVMRQSHADMVEVGATNKTHIFDYERAISENTSMLLKVHPSNYRMIGFTESVSVRQLRHLADEYNAQREDDKKMLVYEDQGSGVFLHLNQFGEYTEPTVADSLRSGADLVSFSGDKLLGGPQAGIIVGNKDLIARLKKHPLARVLRLDKMTLAALEATLRLYLDPEQAKKRIPTIRMLCETADEVQVRAQELHDIIAKKIDSSCASLAIVDEISRAGGGALPMCDIPTRAVALTFAKGTALGCETFLTKRCSTPIIARISQEMVMFDARTLLSTQEMEAIAQGLADYFASIA